MTMDMMNLNLICVRVIKCRWWLILICWNNSCWICRICCKIIIRILYIFYILIILFDWFYSCWYICSIRRIIYCRLNLELWLLFKIILIVIGVRIIFKNFIMILYSWRYFWLFFYELVIHFINKILIFFNIFYRW
jgi:hypothetical protein